MTKRGRAPGASLSPRRQALARLPHGTALDAIAFPRSSCPLLAPSPAEWPHQARRDETDGLFEERRLR
jgi:hypothetical protein